MGSTRCIGNLHKQTSTSIMPTDVLRIEGISMSKFRHPEGTEWFVGKAAMQTLVFEQNEHSGFVPDPLASPQAVRAMMVASGIRPADNLSPYGISAAREE